MSKVISFTTRLPIENTEFVVDKKDIRGEVEYKKFSYFVYRTGIYKRDNKKKETTYMAILEKDGGGLIKEPVDILSTKKYVVIVDKYNIYMIDVRSDNVMLIWYEEEEEEKD